MRLLSRVLAIVLVCLIAVALPSVPAQAQCGGPFIELSLKSGLPGTEVTVHGYQFAEGRPIDIYYDGILVSEGTETDSDGDFTIVIRIPEGCSGHYQVHAEVGYADADTYFHVMPGLTVSPQKGSVGTNVTVKGQGFAKNEESIELYFNGQTIERNITANAKGSWETSFRIPVSGRGEHKIDAQGDESRLYEVKDAIFRVTAEISIDRSSGIMGNTVTMSGSKFATHEKGITILFDGEAVVTDIKASSKGEWETSFQVPEIPAGGYSVTAEGEQTRKEDVGELSFEIEPDIVLSPDEGHVGMELTVAGHGFTTSEDVNIIYDDNQVATVETNEKGSFEVSFSVPESQHGERLVTARVSGGTNSTADLNPNASAIFTIESDSPPMPTLISPSKESRVGFMGDVTPTFEWSEVSDESGVRYSLQIATSADFTTSSVIVTVTDLTETNYTLTETEALPLGTYYWIVQAVDDAENESGWTAASFFRVGFLPLWGLIAIIAAAVVLLVLLIRALIIRRTIYYDGW